tara:strand:+ start:10818 stop:11669 length:852 start_codon:yes stop_codon:yes gene_type:complete
MFFSILGSVVTSAQVGIGTTTPQGALDISSSNSGVVIPRVGIISATDNTTVINPNGGAVLPSTMIYNDGSGGFTPVGFLFWNGANWTAVSGKSSGDIKHGFQSADHNGWYLLDGRSISSLPANAQTAANNLGFSGNLPDATNRVLKNTNGSESLGSTTGSNSVTLSQANLPNFDMSGTTSTDGNHNHSGSTSEDGEHDHNYEDSGVGTTNARNNGNPSQAVEVADGISSVKETDEDGDHTHSLNINSNGNHNHTVSVNSGGSNSAINTTPASLVTNTFIFLGK